MSGLKSSCWNILWMIDGIVCVVKFRRKFPRLWLFVVLEHFPYCCVCGRSAAICGLLMAPLRQELRRLIHVISALFMRRWKITRSPTNENCRRCNYYIHEARMCGWVLSSLTSLSRLDLTEKYCRRRKTARKRVQVWRRFTPVQGGRGGFSPTVTVAHWICKFLCLDT